MRCLLTAAFIMVAGGASAARHPIDMVLPCQQNKGDGRILISDGTLLPETVKSYKIKSYKPIENTGDGWTKGTCVLAVAKGMRD